MAPVNKVHHASTMARVAEMLGEDEDWLWDVANDMNQEDGLIWVYGIGDDGVMAFTEFGIETLVDLIKIWAFLYAPGQGEAAEPDLPDTAS